MKTKLILGSLLALASIGNTQTNTFPSSGNAGIGTLSPAENLQIYTSTSGSSPSSLGMSGFAPVIRFYNANTTPSGPPFSVPYSRIALATAANHWVQGSVAGDFIIQNVATTSTISGNGKSIIFSSHYDSGNGVEHMRINESGNVGIGTSSPGSILHVQKSLAAPPSSTDIYGIRSDMAISTYTGAGPASRVIGVSSIATGYNNIHHTVGIFGMGTNGVDNIGGDFIASGGQGAGASNYGVRSSVTGNTYCYGVSGSATGNTTNYGIYGTASGGSSDWAGYFAGDTYCTGTYLGSDRKLKNNIKPFANALDKIMLLKPSTYTFKSDDFNGMNLPKGQQIGLIAQELEEVFPELIAEMSEITEIDKDGAKKVISPSFKSVNYTSLIPVLIAGIQEQQKTIQALQNQLDGQKQVTDQLSQKSSATTGINSTNSVETGFQMSQNEPNPFTHETVVKYTLPQTISNAFMAVYDLTGKQITTFPINEKGSSSITITSEKLAAGIYIYSIVADGKVVDSKRMIVAEK